MEIRAMTRLQKKRQSTVEALLSYPKRAAYVAAVNAVYYNIPIFTWGLSNSYALGDITRYPTDAFSVMNEILITIIVELKDITSKDITEALQDVSAQAEELNQIMGGGNTPTGEKDAYRKQLGNTEFSVLVSNV
ncbi:hypothetical protein KIN20_008720 [Parelaphostrongylus tenuis]|uniref:Uncharacterized protein n=1 Tax=Parelaphostrongylus tenuis TaxID=148309 RepID=A0AAD5MWZ7_PARTN|nr:hypothetical protein KIN20_008720 [Parelaphostrongylus tenuis]